MFDGNYRSQRRPVNLSGKRKTNTSKQAVLEQARIRREERRRLAAQQEAATKIQRWFRGSSARDAVAQQWRQEMQQLLEVPSVAVVANAFEDCATPRLNAWLGLKSAPAALRKHQEQILSLLQQYAVWLERVSESLQKPPPQSQRIICWTLKYIQSAKSVPSPQQIETILSYCLDVPMQQSETELNQQAPAKKKADCTYYSRRAGERGFRMLVETFCGALHLDAQLKGFLYKCVRFTIPDNAEGRALQAVLAMTNELSSSTTTTTSERICVSELLEVLQRRQKGDGSALLSGTVQKLIAQQSAKIFQSLVQHCRDSTNTREVANMMQLLRILLLENLGGDTSTSQRISLLWTLSRAVRGDNLESTSSWVAPSTLTAELLDSESDEEEDDSDARAHSTSVTLKSSKTPSYRLTKHELQTTAKLDRLFASHVKRATDLLTVVEEKSLVSKLSDSGTWLHWGKILLTDVRVEDSMDEDNVGLRQAQLDFVKILAVMLQGTTGLRPGQNASSSTLLNKLAFSTDFLERLWKLIVRELGEIKTSVSEGPAYSAASSSAFLYHSFSLFSDLFAHNLIALRDDRFLAVHTKSQRPDVPILAEDVISRLRVLLYEIYWTKPVRAEDYKLILGEASSAALAGLVANTEDEQISALRARLLLTGTKLWNSLYERWCRLVRPNPFCVEGTWWFPSMVTLSGDNAVTDTEAVTANRGGGNGRGARNDAMDIDDEESSSSDDSDMEEDNGDHPADPEAEALAEAFSDPKMARVLASIPQALPFDRRVQLFSALLRASKARTQNEEAEMHEAMLAMMRGHETGLPGRERVEIHRDKLYDDSMRQLNQLGPKLKRRVQVSYINQYGAQEAGIDGGGILKEYIDDLIGDAFAAEDSTAPHKLFSVTPLQTLKVNSELPPDNNILSHYEFLGRVLGKAVYESILVEPQFCLPFLNQLLGKSNSMEDLKNYDPEYYRNLTKLLSLSYSELGSMGLTFELTVGSGVTGRTVELIPGGRSIEVTKQNAVQYIHLVSHQRMNVQSARQTRAFLTGFRDLIPASWVRLFSAYELQKLISGDDSVKGIDVDSFKQSMQYAGGYHPDQPVMKWFWEIVNDMTPDQQQKLLKFMTSCSRQPLLGFGSLEPAPCIQQIRLNDALFHQQDRDEIIKRTPLPTSSTCMNLLKLPHYRDKELMRWKLLAAIESGAGFELT